MSRGGVKKRAKHGMQWRLLVRCDGCGRIQMAARGAGKLTPEQGGALVAPCPTCGCDTARYATPA